MAKSPGSFQADTSPTKEIVVSGLTRDATIQACVFDLIDNAIDAARNSAFKNVPESDRSVLLTDYSAYRISLTIGAGGLSIQDNCGGISPGQLETSALRFGKKSDHRMGIGVFGVGLNRALFKLGQRSTLTTDDGVRRSTVKLVNADYLVSPDWVIPGTSTRSKGPDSIGTLVRISEPPEEIARVVGDDEWLEHLSEEIAQRYTHFLQKKLTLVVNDETLLPVSMAIRERGPFPSKKKFFRTTAGVSIHIRCGQHAFHRFPKEGGYDKEVNKGLTDVFGWTIFCNDRAIVVADQTDKTGWEGWHTEFNGFVGQIEFVCAEPDKLPWSTDKTDVDLNNQSFRTALQEMRRFNGEWRSFSERRKRPGFSFQQYDPKGKKVTEDPSPKDGKDKAAGAQPSSGKTKPEEKKPTKKPDYHTFSTILPDDIDEAKINDKLLTIVHEAKELDLTLSMFCGMALMRMLFEMSVMMFLHRNGKYDELKAASLAKRKEKVTLSATEEKNLTPEFSEILAYLDNNPGTWGAKSAHVKHSLKRMIGHQGALNSAIHNPFQTFNRQKAVEIRDDALPLLRLLIET